MAKASVAVLGGGRSSEHEVSLASAASVADGLREAGYEVRSVEIGRDGIWREGGQPLSLTPGSGFPAADVVFPVLHGPFGEDGTVQGLLECLDVPYVGAGVLASALCMDKVTFKELMTQAGIPQVRYLSLTEASYRAAPERQLERLADLVLPVFVKPARLGSSVGIERVLEEGELPGALERAFAHDPIVIVEAAATGLEVECSVIGNGELTASPPGEIVLSGEAGGWYDYEAKYTPGGMQLVVPARLPGEVIERVRELAMRTYSTVGCCGMARVDFFVESPNVLVNELNTIPGFTQTSVFGSLFEASGVPYPELLDRLVQLGLERHAQERRHKF